MATQALTTRDDTWAVMEKVVMNNDLSKLTAKERVAYVRSLSESLGINPLTQPFQYIDLRNNGKLSLYATKNAAEQLRKNNGVSIDKIEKEIVNDTYVVTIYGHDGDGRTDSDMGAVAIKGLSGDALVNAMLKAITKAKRRFTLSICGLGFLDETEVETIREARHVRVDEDGVIHEPAPVRALPQPEQRDTAPSNRQRLLWLRAQQYYGKDASTKLHEIIDVQYPLARKEDKDGNLVPSLKALTTDECNTIIREIEQAMEAEASEPVEGEVVGEQPALRIEADE